MGIGLEDKGASKGDLARSNIKNTARHLFARYGIDTVTIRDIAKAAGQRNGGSVNYYFRSKEDLIREIIDDAARYRDVLSGGRLDEMEASGAPMTIRGLLKANFLPADVDDLEEMRLFTMLQTYRRDLMHTQIPNRWDGSFQRCVTLLRPLLPDYSEAVLRQRLYFLVPYMWTFLATREAIEGQAEFWKEFWADPAAIEGLFDTAEAILIALPSQETQAAMSAV
ncbi:TetR/AcrR family transcriptional regulator [Sphingomonas paeninsulae]|jgi:AcrR family transcriptional regulator|nr:TetR/AcrR family transcriptional regulator [Sphingomonas paeninsulae]